jgi:hypothetical protein
MWEQRGGDLAMVAVAQDLQGEAVVRPIIEERGVTFPVILDRSSVLAAKLGFRMVPSGFFIDAQGIVRYKHLNDFDIRDPRVRHNLDRFLRGEELDVVREEEGMDPRALDLFASGVDSFLEDRREEAIKLWREALDLDPDNFVIRSQIWAVEHPEHFYPAVDRDWQKLQLLKEGYEKGL